MKLSRNLRCVDEGNHVLLVRGGPDAEISGGIFRLHELAIMAEQNGLIVASLQRGHGGVASVGKAV